MIKPFGTCIHFTTPYTCHWGVFSVYLMFEGPVFFFVSNSLFFISSSVFDLSLRSFPWAQKEIFTDSFHELLCGKVSVFICLKMLTLKFPCWEQTPGFPSAPLCASRLHPCCLGSPGTFSASKVLPFIPGPLSHTLLSLPLFSVLPM